MLGRSVLLSGVLLASFAPAPTVAFAAAIGEHETVQPDPDYAKLVEAYFVSLERKQFERAEEIVAVIGKQTPDATIGKGISAIMNSPIQAARKRDAEARRLFSEGVADLQSAPEVLSMILPAYLIVDRRDFAGSIVDLLIARAPDSVRELPADWVYAALRDSGEPTQIVDNRRVGLAEIGFGGNDGDHLIAAAIGILMKRDEVERATALLPYVDSPRVVENLLIQRRFAPLWPALSAQAGTGLAKSREAMIQLALQAYSREPRNNENLAHLVASYRYARRYTDAFALQEKLPRNPAEYAAADEQMGWAVNNMALALHDAGKSDEADRLFAGLNGALPANYWRVNMFINRVELRVQSGKFEAALPLIALAETEPKSPYAEQLLRRLRYCTLTRLGRKEEAAALRAGLMTHATDALGPTVDGLICAGELDAAEQLALRHVDKPDFQEDFVRSLQRKPLTADDPSIWGGWAPLRERPAIAAAFARLGRDLPDALRPNDP